MDVTKLVFAGAVDYAQHNFARLRPLLYSADGRTWEGSAEREWFPTAGLVFTVAAELRYAQTGSLWTFRVARNQREDAADRDRFVAIQIKPAHEFLTSLAPMPVDALRKLGTEDGFVVPAGHKGGALLPEENDKWVLVPELERGDDGRCRAQPGRNLRYLKVYVGDPESIAGTRTSDGRWVLPPSALAADEGRNWQATEAFVDSFAAELRRWAASGPQRTQAHQAAAALRELAPFLATASAFRSAEAKAALARANELVTSVDLVSTLADELVAAELTSERFRAELEERRQELLRTLEAEALASIEGIEAQAKDRLDREKRQLEEELAASSERLAELKAELATLESAATAWQQERKTDVDKFDKAVEKIAARAKREPAALLAEWLGAEGFREAFAREASPATASMTWSNHPLVSGDQLPLELFRASPVLVSDGLLPIMIVDAAIRAREVPLIFGSLAREHVEAWLSVCAGADPVVVAPDPTLLTLGDMLPSGQRGRCSPFAPAIERADANPERLVTVLLDDLDPPSASYWLPSLARAARQPLRYGLPRNVVFLGLVESDPTDFCLTWPRATELFPVNLADLRPRVDAGPTLQGTEADLALVAPPFASVTRTSRAAALEFAARATFKESDAKQLAAAFGSFLSSDGPVGHENLQGPAKLMFGGALRLTSKTVGN